MITKLLDSQRFLKVWKTAVRQKFCAIVSKIFPRNIVYRPLRENILFAYPTNFSLKAFRKKYIVTKLRLKTCYNVKSVIV